MLHRIREVRRAKGYTLLDVAERCDPPTTAQTIGRLETGTRTLSLDWLNRIASALGVDASELVQLPDQEELAVAAHLGIDGVQAPTQADTLVAPRLMGEMVADDNGLAASIGRENEAFGLSEASVIASDYDATGARARVGLMGPTRMDYPSNLAAVRAVARYLTGLLAEDEKGR